MPKVSPQKFHRMPKYPTMEQVANDPELLKILPRRWYTKPAVCAALAFTVSGGLFSCAHRDDGGHSDDCEVLESNRSADAGSRLDGSSEALGLPYVPLFEYGEGRGAFGCVSVTSPLFFSEDEAAQIICDEASRLGVDISRKNTPVIENAKIPETSRDHYDDLGTVGGTLVTDGYAETAGLSFEFVSRDDHNEWEAADKGPMSTVSSFDLKDTAKRLAENNPGVAVFYDPVARVADFYDVYEEWLGGFLKSKGLDINSRYYDELSDDDRRTINNKWSEMYDEYEEAARIEAEENLRAQVKDFIEWLKGQGII